jgi:hypothetical protein
VRFEHTRGEIKVMAFPETSRETSEAGSGSSRKVSLLFEACRSCSERSPEICAGRVGPKRLRLTSRTMSRESLPNDGGRDDRLLSNKLTCSSIVRFPKQSGSLERSADFMCRALRLAREQKLAGSSRMGLPDRVRFSRRSNLAPKPSGRALILLLASRSSSRRLRSERDGGRSTSWLFSRTSDVSEEDIAVKFTCEMVVIALLSRVREARLVRLATQAGSSVTPASSRPRSTKAFIPQKATGNSPSWFLRAFTTNSLSERRAIEGGMPPGPRRLNARSSPSREVRPDMNSGSAVRLLFERISVMRLVSEPMAPGSSRRMLLRTLRVEREASLPMVEGSVASLLPSKPAILRPEMSPIESGSRSRRLDESARICSDVIPTPNPSGSAPISLSIATKKSSEGSDGSDPSDDGSRRSLLDDRISPVSLPRAVILSVRTVSPNDSRFRVTTWSNPSGPGRHETPSHLHLSAATIHDCRGADDQSSPPPLVRVKIENID